ncbi:MAG: hypothetical protein ACR2QJ_14950 [Geminicoccaceae bacterium]
MIRFLRVSKILLPTLALCGLATSLLGGCEYRSKLGTVNTFDEPLEPLSAHVVFLADNQRTLTTAEPIFEQSALVRRVVKSTAHRRPAMENFSLDIVRYILNERTSDAKLVIHVGDVLNNSCRDEFDESMCAMQYPNGLWDKKRKECIQGVAGQKPNPVFVTPGNHEGYFLGITTPIARVAEASQSLGAINQVGGWAQGCTPAYEKHLHVASMSKEDPNAYIGLASSKNLTGNIGTYGYTDPRYLAEAPTGATSRNGYAENILDKYSFVLAYLEKLGIRDFCRQHPSHCQPQRTIGSQQVSCAQTSGSGGKLAYLEEICWTFMLNSKAKEQHKMDRISWPLENRNIYRYDAKYRDGSYAEQKPWRHFVVQRLAIPSESGDGKTHFILADTASYERDGIFGPGGGLTAKSALLLGTNGAADQGSIGPLQQSVLERWIEEVGTKDQVILIGHHPIKDLDEDKQPIGSGYRSSRDFIATLANRPNIGLYISGDNHDGYDVRHTKLNGLREANLGALIDAPLEYAVGSFDLTSKDPRVELTRSFVTPASATQDDHYGFPRSYAVPDGVFQACKARFQFHQQAPAYDPLGSCAENGHCSIYGKLLPQFGIKNPDGSTYRPIRLSKLYIYKINRLINMVEVYRNIYELHGILDFWPITNDRAIIAAEKNRILKASFSNTFVHMVAYMKFANMLADVEQDMNCRLFGERHTEKIDDNPKRCADRYHEISQKTRDDIRWSRLCSALFEAHRDRFAAKAPS